MLRGDNVKDEQGHRAENTTQGASPSQASAAKFLDTISKLLGRAGEASDAVPAYTQVKVTEAPRLLGLSQEEFPEMWIRIPRRQRPISLEKIDDPVVPLQRNLYGHPVAGILGKGRFQEVLFENGWEKLPTWECLHVHKKHGPFLHVCVENVWKEAERGTHAETSATRSRPRKSNAIDGSNVFRDARRMEKTL